MGKIDSAAERAPRILFCDEARQLLQDFGEKVGEVMKLHQQQLEAIMDGDSDAGRFDLLIHEASERKLNAKYAYLSHLQTHRCSPH